VAYGDVRRITNDDIYRGQIPLLQGVEEIYALKIYPHIQRRAIPPGNVQSFFTDIAAPHLRPGNGLFQCEGNAAAPGTYVQDFKDTCLVGLKGTADQQFLV